MGYVDTPRSLSILSNAVGRSKVTSTPQNSVRTAMMGWDGQEVRVGAARSAMHNKHTMNHSYTSRQHVDKNSFIVKMTIKIFDFRQAKFYV